MEHALDQLPLSGQAAEPIDDRPVEVQMSEALDGVAIELVRRLKTAIARDADLKAENLKVYAEAFKLGRDWLLARKKVNNKGEGAREFEAIDAAVEAYDKLTKRKTPPVYGEPIAGVKPPAKKIGKPTNEMQEQKKEYNKLYQKAKEKYDENDDSVLNAKLRAVGAA